MPDASTQGAVFVQTNEVQNAVVAFRRHADGSLEELGSFATGGVGQGEPHLPSQGSVVLTGDGTRLLVTNSGGDDVTTFTVEPSGGLDVVGRSAAGQAPTSVAECDGLVYVLTTG
ncbi:MAG TPA: beta-propeller fold lactonase family protein, partial [Acidimicrobiales bacterium]|nr:beta-propeller fold lactonase family protein [Acidimicrobiales bacterium]